MTDTSLDQLALAAHVGGRADIDRLLEALRPIVARWAVVLTGSPDTAEDVTQVVLLLVHRSFGDYSHSGWFSAWVYRIVRNVVVDMDRKDQREQARLEQLTNDGLAARLPERADTLTLLSAADQLRRFMRDLSPQQSAVLDLVELQGFTAAEAAEMLEIAPSKSLDRLLEALGEGVGNRVSVSVPSRVVAPERRAARGWPRRVRGSIGVGLTWAATWGLAGALMWFIKTAADYGLDSFSIAQFLGRQYAVVGFLGGVTFSALLRLTHGRRRFDELRTSWFAARGALGG